MSEFLNVRSALVNANSVCIERYRSGVEAAKNKEKYETTLQSVNRRIDNVIATSNHLNRMYKNIKHYANEHRDSVYKLLDEAIIEAGVLVPDADVAGVHLKKSENNSITVVNGKGQNVVLREGGGYRAILGALLRYAATKAQPDSLQLMVFDESFFPLSDATTVQMKEILQAMAKDMIIVCIEQRRNVCDGITSHTYVFKKGEDKITKVTSYDEEGVID